MGEQKEREDGEAATPWDCGSPLYDSFELASLYHLLDRNVMTLPCIDGPFRGEMGGREDGKEYKKVVILGGFVEEGMKRKIGVHGGIMKDNKFKKVKASFHGFYSSVAFWKK
ncbi:hypothetical protein AAC387_Pa10g0181 [Persea americana]